MITSKISNDDVLATARARADGVSGCILDRKACLPNSGMSDDTVSCAERRGVIFKEF